MTSTKLTRLQYLPIALTWLVLSVALTLGMDDAFATGYAEIGTTFLVMRLVLLIGMAWVVHARIMDTGGKSWWTFLLFVPLFGFCLWLVLFFLPSKEV
jgi:uncharacterized membrane protein YhaH (DUF805 family)